jgi:dihydroneopterin aldolase
MGKIAIEGMEFFAYHGCFSEEQIIGTRFVVDLTLETDTRQAEASDKLSRTINYQEVYLAVKAQMIIKSNLLEHLGRRILDAVMAQFAPITHARIRIAKMNPPLGGKVGSVSITLDTDDE